MKKAFTICVLLITLGATAQHEDHHRKARPEHHPKLTVEQNAQIQSKKMTLALGLSNQQQERLATLLGEQMTNRQAIRRELRRQDDSDQQSSPEARFNRMNQRLDMQIAFQRELKEILSESQLEQWKDLKAKRHFGKRHRGGRR